MILNDRFGKDWCLSPEQSLNLHMGNWTVPKQLLVRTPRGGNKPTRLLFDTSVFDVLAIMQRQEYPPYRGDPRAWPAVATMKFPVYWGYFMCRKSPAVSKVRTI
jgi:hypothetical protein